jgi:hypothetical protein
MFKLGALVVSGISASYLGFEANRLFKFKAFKESGHDENFRIFEGVVTKSNDQVIESDLIVRDGNVVKDEVKRLLRKVDVQEGKKKVGTYHTPMTVGNQTIMVPHTYTYTDYKTIVSKTFWTNEFKVGAISVQMPDVSKVDIDLKTMEAKMFPQHTRVAFELLQHPGPNPNANRYKFREGHISYGDNVTVAGEYTHKKLTVSYIGDKQTVLDMIRRNKYAISGPGIFIAGSAIIASIYVICSDDPDP